MAEQEKKRPSAEAVLTATYRLLNALAKHPQLLDDSRITDKLFANETAKSVYIALRNLYDKQIPITAASLLQAGQEVDYTINRQIVTTIFEIDPQGAEKIEDILDNLRTVTVKDDLLSKIDVLREQINQPGKLDGEKLLGNLYDIDQIVQYEDKDRTTLLDFSSLSDKYLVDLENRKIGRKYSFGDPLLDDTIKRGAIPGGITIVTAQTSMGKSTFVLSLADNLLDRNCPCMFLSLEMGTIDTMDRFIAKRCEIENDDLYDPATLDGVIERVKEEQKTLTDRKNFYFCEATSVTLSKLRNLIREFKQKAHTTYGTVIIDLLSGMKDFMVGTAGGSSAATIENNMNKLEDLAKEENVHIFGVVQLRRDSAESSRIHTVEDIEKLRPSLNDIKNSGAFGEKAGVVLGLFRPKYYLDRYKVEEPEVVAQTPDILEVQILKDRNGGSAGRILKYMFDGSHFKVYPLIEEENSTTKELEDLNFTF